jgi:hypothetical protein
LNRAGLGLVGVGAIALAVAAGLLLSPDVGPPVDVAAPAPVAAAPAPAWEAPDVPAAPAVAPAPARSEAVRGEASEETFGLPSDPWEGGDVGAIEKAPNPAHRQKQLKQLREEMPDFMQLIDAAQMCDAVPDPMHAQLDSLASMIAEYAHEDDGGNATRGLALIRAYEPRLEQYMREGHCE